MTAKSFKKDFSSFIEPHLIKFFLFSNTKNVETQVYTASLSVVVFRTSKQFTKHRQFRQSAICSNENWFKYYLQKM